MELLASCLEMSWGGKHSSCNSMNASPQNICGLQKEILQKGKIAFSIQFLLNGGHKYFLGQVEL